MRRLTRMRTVSGTLAEPTSLKNCSSATSSNSHVLWDVEQFLPPPTARPRPTRTHTGRLSLAIPQWPRTPLQGLVDGVTPSSSTIRYDTIRDAMLTCARKPTWVRLIYRTEPTTKKCKNRKKLKQIWQEITVNSPGNPRSKYLSRKKGRATVGKICREGRF